MSFFDATCSAFIILFFAHSSICQIFSPCPNVFEYRYDNFDNLYGYIEVPTPKTNSNKITLEVQFSVGNVVHGSNGNIALTEGRAQTLQDILSRRNIRYNVNFPYWKNIPPRITLILVNGKVLCSGLPIPSNTVPVVTTVNLQHSLTVTYPPDYYIPLDDFDRTTETTFVRPTKFVHATKRPQVNTPVITPDVACGVSINANSLIFGGSRFGKASHPWLGALFAQKIEGITFTCGTTLVSQRHAITAGHCVYTKRKRYRAEELWVVLGRENIQRWSNDGAQIIQAEKLHVHPDFKFTTADGDIAIIVLGEDAIFSTLIRPACLWTENPISIVDRVGIVVGWGRDENGATSSEPKQVSFPVVSEGECLRSNSGFREITSSRTFCAGYRNNSGPCNGDSGGGFLMQVDGRWTLRGVVSMSLATPEGACDLSQYVVFTDVAQYGEWMLTILPK
ncbi:hypothetical protein FQR65_LT14603 [Abscondita terminalis]|nr:hypothetical protein FQR65_LT14603 [Abscondita terminalis]